MIRVEVDLDPYDSKRSALIEKIKKDGNAWVGRYASGGKTNQPSASKVYTAISDFQGWIAFNGLAPIPALRKQKLLDNLTVAEELIGNGR